MELSALYRYPLKSAAAVPALAAEVEARGLAGDRRWLVVDPDGHFLTGRQCPGLVRVQAHPTRAGVTLSAPGCEAIDIPQPVPPAPRFTVTVWNDRIDALAAGPAADRWLSKYLQRPARLVHMDRQVRRPVDPDYAGIDDQVSFADAFPLLLISQSALDQLNTRLAQPLPMLRFRPNLVIAGCPPHAEDGWRRLRIGDVELLAVKPCTRCVFTTVDPGSGEFDASGEPLRTLKTYRRHPPADGGEERFAQVRGITFGMNLVPRGHGTIRVGDPVVALD